MTPFLLLVALTGVAPLQAANEATGAAKTDKQLSWDRQVRCVSGATIGSRLPGPKLCKTNLEWDRERTQAREGTERSQMTNVIHGN